MFASSFWCLHSFKHKDASSPLLVSLRVIRFYIQTKRPTNLCFHQHVFLPANCAEISKVTSGGGNWILRDLGPPEAKAFDRKYSSCIRL